MTNKVCLSGFADEISPDLDTQLDVLQSEGIRHLELRGVWGKNALELTNTEAKEVKGELDRRGMAVSSLGSPIGKIKITDPFEPHLQAFCRALELANLFRTRYIRMFSFFIDKDARPEDYRGEVIGRLQALGMAAKGSDVTLLHENEKEIYGDTGERCADLMDALQDFGVRAVFDPANFIQCGVRPMTEAYPLLQPFVEYVHIKDALFDDGKVVPAGAGDGQVKLLLEALQQQGYTGFLSLEPHLSAAGTFSGFSGPDLFVAAVRALKGLLAELNWDWE